MVTAAASERGAGIDPAVVAVAPRVPLLGLGRVNACTVATVAGDPPPKTRARPPSSAAAASCRGALSAPMGRGAPVAVLKAEILLAETPPTVSPPRTISWPGE